MDTETRVRAFDRYLSRVQPPLASSPDAKEVMEALTTKNYFTTICDEAFGPMKCGDDKYQSRAVREAMQTEYYWMDEANNSAPDSTLCAALMSLLGPRGSLFNIMEQTSKPCKGFGTMLRGAWRGDNAANRMNSSNSSLSRGAAPPTSCVVEPTEQPFRSTTLLPLPALCDFSADILNENPDHDLATLPRERVIPLMLLPFWDPPIDLRTVISRPPKRDSLQSTMLAHFLFRLFSYANTRCGLHGRSMLSSPPPSASATVSVWIDYCKKLVMGKEIVNRPSTGSFHFYQKLALAYIDHFVTSNVVSKFNTKAYGPYTQANTWSETEIAALICLQGPSAMWLHRSNRPSLEFDRCRISDPSTLALAAQSLWALEASFVKLECEVAGKGLLVDSTREYGVVASADLMYPLRTCYRSCLVAIRTMAMSLPYVQCVDEVYRDLIRLWRALITAPIEADTAGMSTYFFHHYESFSIIFVEMMDMMQSRTFAEAASAETLILVRKALAEFLCEPIPALLKSVTDLVAVNGKELDRIRRWNVLDWSRADGGPTPVVAPLGEEARVAAARVNRRFTNIMEQCRGQHASLPLRRGRSTPAHDALTAKITAIGEVLESLSKIFVTLAEDTEKLDSHSSPIRNNRTSSAFPSTAGASLFGGNHGSAEVGSVNTVDDALHANNKNAAIPSRYHALARLNLASANGDADGDIADRLGSLRLKLSGTNRAAASSAADLKLRTVTADERREFLSGKRAVLDFVKSADVKFANGRVASDSYEVLRSHEIPALIPFVRGLDTIIDFIQYTFYTKKAFKCPRGHVMSLVGDSNQRCCEHTMNRAVYECLACRVGYCESCSGPPQLGDGRRIKACLPTTLSNNKSCCDRCGVVFYTDSSVGFVMSSRRGVVWCAGCASRPWSPVSVRFLASRHTYLMLFLVFLLYLLLTFIYMSATSGGGNDDQYNGDGEFELYYSPSD